MGLNESCLESLGTIFSILPIPRYLHVCIVRLGKGIGRGLPRLSLVEPTVSLAGATFSNLRRSFPSPEIFIFFECSHASLRLEQIHLNSPPRRPYHRQYVNDIGDDLGTKRSCRPVPHQVPNRRIRTQSDIRIGPFETRRCPRRFGIGAGI